MDITVTFDTQRSISMYVCYFQKDTLYMRTLAASDDAEKSFAPLYGSIS